MTLSIPKMWMTKTMIINLSNCNNMAHETDWVQEVADLKALHNKLEKRKEEIESAIYEFEKPRNRGEIFAVSIAQAPGQGQYFKELAQVMADGGDIDDALIKAALYGMKRATETALSEVNQELQDALRTAHEQIFNPDPNLSY